MFCGKQKNGGDESCTVERDDELGFLSEEWTLLIERESIFQTSVCMKDLNQEVVKEERWKRSQREDPPAGLREK